MGGCYRVGVGGCCTAGMGGVVGWWGSCSFRLGSRVVLAIIK